jgi:hypothetical protein
MIIDSHVINKIPALIGIGGVALRLHIVNVFSS